MYVLTQNRVFASKSVRVCRPWAILRTAKKVLYKLSSDAFVGRKRRCNLVIFCRAVRKFYWWTVKKFPSLCCRRVKFCHFPLTLPRLFNSDSLQVCNQCWQQLHSHYFLTLCSYACHYVLAFRHVVQRPGLTISSSVWRMSVLSTHHLPYGTTHCVVSIQALYLMERLSLCIVRTTYRRSDTSSSSFL